MAEGAGHHAEGRAALALAVAGMHQQQAVFVLGLGDLLVDDGLLALHARLVAGVAVNGFGHGNILVTVPGSEQ
ncbi:hypothetical protein D3C86_2102710 [compost metagenome]